jgi:hypothetical protein
MAQTAAHLVECVIRWVPTRQWVVSVPIPLRYWMASSRDLTAQVYTIIRRTIAQYYITQAGIAVETCCHIMCRVCCTRLGLPYIRDSRHDFDAILVAYARETPSPSLTLSGEVP